MRAEEHEEEDGEEEYEDIWIRMRIRIEERMVILSVFFYWSNGLRLGSGSEVGFEEGFKSKIKTWNTDHGTEIPIKIQIETEILDWRFKIQGSSVRFEMV